MKAPRRLGLGTQVALLAAVVALVTATIGALTAVALVRSPAETQARASLHRETLIVARFLEARGSTLSAPRAVGALRVLQAEHIALVHVGADGAIDPPGAGVTAADASSLLRGTAVHAVRRVGGQRSFIDGTPLRSGGGIVLVQPTGAVKALTAPLRRRIVTALAIAVALAALAGVLLARRVTRPLRSVAGSARAMAGGSRGVSVSAGGSQEVDDLAGALADLDRALAVSEDRQRQFLLSVSHELRTPLTSLRGFAESLADGVVEDPAATGAVLVEEAERLDRLVSDLLDLARLRADSFRVRPVPSDLHDLFAATARVWQSRCAAAGVSFQAAATDSPVPAVTDPDRLRQVLDNLLENALRVTPAGGEITFALSDRTFTVSDTGPGLSDADLAVAFEPGALHERFDGVRPVGTGVGLALAAGLVERLGGEVTAGRRPQGGARFTVSIPDRTRTPT